MNYYYISGTEHHGPNTLDELRELFARGEITAATKVAREGDAAWQPLSSLKGWSDKPIPIPVIISSNASELPEHYLEGVRRLTCYGFLRIAINSVAVIAALLAVVASINFDVNAMSRENANILEAFAFIVLRSAVAIFVIVALRSAMLMLVDAVDVLIDQNRKKHQEVE